MTPSRIIGDFFGVIRPDQLLLCEAENAVKTLFIHIERLHTRRFSHRSDRDALFTIAQQARNLGYVTGLGGRNYLLPSP